MPCYICNFCNKEFKLKGDYTRHINRKYKCYNSNDINVNIIPNNGQDIQNNGQIIPKNNFTCNFCNNKYKQKSHLNRHQKTCKIKLAQEKDNELKEELLSVLLKKMDNMQNNYEKQINTFL